MRNLVYYVAVSLDGYIAGPAGEYDALLAEGDHMDAVFARYPDALPTAAAAGLGIEQRATTFDTVVMGWNTYAVGLPFGMTSPYSHLRQLVFSRARGADSVGEGVTVSAADPVEVVRQLKTEDGADIWLCGGGSLAAALVGEIDRLVLKVSPVVFGAGIPLFAGDGYEPRAFDLVDSTAYGSGVIITEYARGAS
ncbi:dihydrofolate reductase family protein [Agromyces ramosus]|uniref:Dihydrofolate reductase n=1 Tax=Agromyces ramosus TaxID=33879 RepID=A0ABU0R9E4_9MICO|nr:dihydrofolate reductase family protein [Agromyces ramosus]MDQ0894352.1 dihydrofolate reductase [Agromyces ramosus]